MCVSALSLSPVTKRRYGSAMTCMKPIATALLALALASCGNIGGPLGPSAEKRTADALNACMEASSDHSAMIQAAGQRAVSEAYASEAKAAAETCRQSRTTLRDMDQNHPCLPAVEYFEEMNWALASSFEGKQDFGTYAMTVRAMEGDPTACARAWGATPEELADMQPTPEELAAEAEATRAADEADRAAQEAQDAAADAMAAAAASFR